MKKSLLFILSAAALLAGCAKSVEEEAVEPQLLPGYKTVTLNASAEAADSKVAFADDETFGWQSGDAIGMYVYDHANSERLYLEAKYSGTAGEKSGPFTLTLPEEADYYKVAWYPYVSSNGNWTDEGVFTFDLYSEIKDVDPGCMLMPMVAYFPDDENKEDISFKNVGALVKVTLKNVPAEAKYFKLVSDQQLSGPFQIEAEKLGEEGGVLAPSKAGSNSVQINLEGEARESLVLYFPVPVGELKFGFEIYGDDLTIFQMGLSDKSKPNKVERGAILRMPEIEIPATSTDYKLIGYHAKDASWSTDVDAEALEGHFGWVVFKDITAGESGNVSFKLRKGASWDSDDAIYGASVKAFKVPGVLVPLSHPGNDITLVGAGNSYDIYFNEADETVFALAAGSEFAVPEATSEDNYYHLIGSTAKTAWDNEYYPSEAVEGLSDWRVIKNVEVNSDNNITFKLRKVNDWADEYVFGATEAGTFEPGTLISLAHPGGDIKIEGASGSKFDVYVNANAGKAIVLAAGEEFDFPVTTDKGGLYKTIQAAVDAAVEGEVITVAPGTYDEHVVIKEDKGITIEGKASETKAAGDAAVVSSFEIMKAAVTIKNITIKPEGEFFPTLETVPAGYNYPFGVYIYRSAYGVVLDNIVLDLSAAHANTTGIFSICKVVNGVNDPEYGDKRDAIRNSVIGGTAARRNAQLYYAKMDIENNTIAGGHRDYGLRMGYALDVKLSGNSFSNCTTGGKGFGIDFYNLDGGNVVFGDGTADNNTFDSSFTAHYGTTTEDTVAGDNTFAPTGYFDNMIFVFGEKPKVTKVEKLWDAISTDSANWMSSFGGTANTDFNIAIDDKNVYVAEFGGSKNIWAIPVKGGVSAATAVNNEGIESVGFDGSIFLSCARVINKEDGTPVLLVSNLFSGDNGRIYAYENGINAAPKVITLNQYGAGRRLGDTFSVYGTYEKAMLIFATHASGANGFVTFQLPPNKSNVSGLWNRLAISLNAEFEGYWPFPGELNRGMFGKRIAGGDGYRSRYMTIDATEDTLWDTSSAAFTATTTNLGWLANSQNFSGTAYNFVEFNGKRYVIFGSNTNYSGAKAQLFVKEGSADTDWVDILNTDGFICNDALEGTVTTGWKGGLDVAVYKTDSEVYIAINKMNTGIAVYRMYAE